MEKLEFVDLSVQENTKPDTKTVVKDEKKKTKA